FILFILTQFFHLFSKALLLFYGTGIKLDWTRVPRAIVERKKFATLYIANCFQEVYDYAKNVQIPYLFPFVQEGRTPPLPLSLYITELSRSIVTTYKA
ncbi:hypothetical protein ABEY41_28255, partial [Peribacillus butanolivorans]